MTSAWRTGRGPCSWRSRGSRWRRTVRPSSRTPPTERGVKHLRGLARAVEQGYRAAVFFVVQMEGVDCFRPNDRTHPAFGEALRAAAKGGVGVYAYDCLVTPDSLAIRRPVEVVL